MEWFYWVIILIVFGAIILIIKNKSAPKSLADAVGKETPKSAVEKAKELIKKSLPPEKQNDPTEIKKAAFSLDPKLIQDIGIGVAGGIIMSAIAEAIDQAILAKMGQKAGTKVVSSLGKKGASKAGKAALGKVGAKAAGKMAAKGGERAAVGFGSKFGTKAGMGPVGWALMVFDVVSITLDLTDPMKYNKSMTNADIKEIEDQFKKAFKEEGLKSLKGELTKQGLPTDNVQWPMEVMPEIDYKASKYTEYITEYITKVIEAEMAKDPNYDTDKLPDTIFEAASKYAEQKMCSEIAGTKWDEESGQCKYTQEGCWAKSKWPLAPDTTDVYSVWDKATGKCVSGNSLLREWCEDRENSGGAEGLSFNREDETCRVNEQYCKVMGFEWKDGDCKMEPGQNVAELIFGTTITRGVKKGAQEFINIFTGKGTQFGKELGESCIADTDCKGTGFPWMPRNVCCGGKCVKSEPQPATGVQLCPMKPCPDGYIEADAVCLKKEAYTRPAVGVIDSCPEEFPNYEAGLCYGNCESGYNPVGAICWRDATKEPQILLGERGVGVIQVPYCDDNTEDKWGLNCFKDKCTATVQTDDKRDGNGYGTVSTWTGKARTADCTCVGDRDWSKKENVWKWDQCPGDHPELYGGRCYGSDRGGSAIGYVQDDDRGGGTKWHWVGKERTAACTIRGTRTITENVQHSDKESCSGPYGDDYGGRCYGTDQDKGCSGYYAENNDEGSNWTGEYRTAACTCVGTKRFKERCNLEGREWIANCPLNPGDWTGDGWQATSNYGQFLGLKSCHLEKRVCSTPGDQPNYVWTECNRFGRSRDYTYNNWTEVKSRDESIDWTDCGRFGSSVDQPGHNEDQNTNWQEKDVVWTDCGRFGKARSADWKCPDDKPDFDGMLCYKQCPSNYHPFITDCHHDKPISMPRGTSGLVCKGNVGKDKTQDQFVLACYNKCEGNYSGGLSGPVCVANCPEGYPDLGAACAKPLK